MEEVISSVVAELDQNVTFDVVICITVEFNGSDVFPSKVGVISV